MTRDEFNHNLQISWKLWEARWKGTDLARTLDRTAPGELNQRDFLVHIAWLEHDMVQVARQHALAGSLWWELLRDEKNVRILAERHSLSLQ